MGFENQNNSKTFPFDKFLHFIIEVANTCIEVLHISIMQELMNELGGTTLWQLPNLFLFSK